MARESETAIYDWRFIHLLNVNMKVNMQTPDIWDGPNLSNNTSRHPKLHVRDLAIEPGWQVHVVLYV